MCEQVRNSKLDVKECQGQLIVYIRADTALAMTAFRWPFFELGVVIVIIACFIHSLF